jgi:hypothetical protein
MADDAPVLQKKMRPSTDQIGDQTIELLELEIKSHLGFQGRKRNNRRTSCNKTRSFYLRRIHRITEMMTLVTTIVVMGM